MELPQGTFWRFLTADEPSPGRLIGGPTPTHANKPPLKHNGEDTRNRSEDTASVKGEAGGAVGVGRTAAGGGGRGAVSLGRVALVGAGVLGVLRGCGSRLGRLGRLGDLVGRELARVAAEDVALTGGMDWEGVSKANEG